MLKVMIVDDEEHVREDLKTAVNWNQCGYEICGEAENGPEALEKLVQLCPDLLITDIRMPGMDGLQMIWAMKEQNRSCRIIILTGYSEFQYARRSIALGVDSYLLKPIDEEELLLQIEKVRRSLLEERRLILYTREKMITNLIEGFREEEREDILEKANKTYKLFLPWRSYQVLLIDTFEGSLHYRNLGQGFKNELEAFASENRYGYVFEKEGRGGILIRNFSFEENTLPLEFLHKRLTELFDADFALALGSCVSEMEDIPLSYERANNLIKNKFIWGDRRLVGYTKDILSGLRSQGKTAVAGELAQQIYTAVDLNNKKEIKRLISLLAKGAAAAGSGETDIKSAFIETYFEVIRKILLNNPAMEDMNLSQALYAQTSMEGLIRCMTEKLSELSDELAQSRPDTPMKKIIDYIQRNYRDDIKIENLARLFGYNSIYLGQLFKNATGSYFNTYLEGVRIENAKGYLREGLKVYQVARRIGYRNLDYFSAKFKRYVGVSPSEYRESADMHKE